MVSTGKESLKKLWVIIDIIGINGSFWVVYWNRTTFICINSCVSALRACLPLNLDKGLSWELSFFAPNTVVNAVVVNLNGKDSENQKCLTVLETLWQLLPAHSLWKWSESYSVMSYSLRHHGLSTEFSRPEYWSGSPFPSPGDLPNPGIEPGSPALQVDSLPTELSGKPFFVGVFN